MLLDSIVIHFSSLTGIFFTLVCFFLYGSFLLSFSPVHPFAFYFHVFLIIHHWSASQHLEFCCILEKYLCNKLLTVKVYRAVCTVHCALCAVVLMAYRTMINFHRLKIQYYVECSKNCNASRFLPIKSMEKKIIRNKMERYKMIWFYFSCSFLFITLSFAGSFVALYATFSICFKVFFCSIFFTFKSFFFLNKSHFVFLASSVTADILLVISFEFSAVSMHSSGKSLTEISLSAALRLFP